jgi:hypothetical protein
MPSLIEMEGKAFGQWIVLRKGTTTFPSRKLHWICICSCGRLGEQSVDGSDLRKGNSTRCTLCARNSQAKTISKFNDKEKFCASCEKWKSLEDFHKSGKRKSGRTTYCAECNSFRKHKLTFERYHQLLKAQDNKCAFIGCNNYPTDVDHDHQCCSGPYSCGKCIRGLLCKQHNQALGQFEDNVAIIRAAANYLEAYKEKKDAEIINVEPLVP